MKLGFVSAILGELSLEEVLAFADAEGFPTVELMCWPPGAAERRYSGVTHVDVTKGHNGYCNHVRDLLRIHGVEVSGLGYYPNPLDPDPEHRRRVIAHLKLVMRFAATLGIPIVNTFIGRDPGRTVEGQLPLLKEVWSELFDEAKKQGVVIGIENCPMIFSHDEWPGGKNMATGPANWDLLFQAFPDAPLGLNFDPSHTVWQFIDTARCVREYGGRFVHVHAKDERIDTEKLYRVGAQGLGWHTPKLPGLGNVDWGGFFAALTTSGYRGAVSIEVEDRAYEGSIDDRKRALRQSKRFLQQFMG